MGEFLKPGKDIKSKKEKTGKCENKEGTRGI
jgi:hypothetical protein